MAISSRIIARAIATILIGLIVTLLTVAFDSRSATGGAALARISNASAYRTVEGRLSTDDRYRPLRSSLQALSSEDEARLLRAAGELQRAAAALPTSANLHAWGIAELALGRIDAAVETLQTALQQRPDDAVLLADLGAALLAEATELNRPEDLPRAAEVLEQALRRAPRLPAAWFTKARVLERLFLPAQARAALQEYQALDGSSGWGREVAERLHMAPAATIDWSQVEKALAEGALNDTQLDGTILRHQLDVREAMVRTLLPAWARARGTRARQEAGGRIRQVADALERHSTDPYFQTIADELAAAQDRAPEEMSSAILALAAGLDAQRAQKPAAEIDPPLSTAASILGGQQSNLLLWVQLAQARAASQIQAHDQVVALATSVAVEAERLGFPSLEARAHWLLGMTAFTASRWADAAGHYERAIRLCERTHESGFAASVHVNAAVLSRFLGNRRETWQHRVAAGAGFPPHAIVSIHSYLTSGAATASSEGLPLAALLFQHEVIANARDPLPVGPQTEAFLSRARMLARVNRDREASNDLDEASRLLERVASEGIRARLQRAWLLASAEVRLRFDPTRAAEDASRAIALITRTNEPIRLAEAALLESRALTASGDFARARSAAEQGITAFEAALRSIDPRDPVRVAALEPVWALYSESARLELRPGREDYAAAFAILERGRARTQLDLRRVEPLALEDVRRRLRDGEGIVVLDQSPDELVSWWISRTSVKVERTPLVAADLDWLVTEHRRSIDRGRRRDPSSARLFDLALRHCRDDLRKTPAVAVIADGAWNRVAWPTLWDRSSDAELVDEVAIVLAPSVAVVLRERPASATPLRSALVVSAPLTEGGAPLSGVRAEARTIAKLYEHSRILEGVESSPARVLEVLSSMDVVHIASHAVDVPSYPQLSHLVLGGENRTERLFVRDVTTLDLAHVRLVVLAACATAGRTAVRGEGSVGVAWGFLTAGVPRVVATLQEIEDNPAQRLFSAFHRSIASGRSAAQSLHAVQREMAAAGESPRVWGTVAVYGAL